MASAMNPGTCFVRLNNPITDHGFVVNFSNQMPGRKGGQNDCHNTLFPWYGG